MNILKKYDRNRLWHINGNIIISGILSAMIVSAIIHASEIWEVGNIGHVVLFTFALDTLIDPAIFFLLHYRSSKQGLKEFRYNFFIKDAIRIQGHRIILTGLYYLIALSLQFTLLLEGVRSGKSVIYSYVTALLITRIIHTFYGLKTGLFETKDK